MISFLPAPNLSEIKAWLKTQVSGKRYKHIKGVAQTAKKLAIRYNLSEEKAELAGWLHDCAKELPKSAMLDWISKSHFTLDPAEQKLPSLWHPHAGAAIALKKWKIKDEQILDAIRRHTLGSPSMGPLAQVVFVADFIEPGRDFEGVDQVRKAAKKSVNKAVLLKCSMTINHLLSKKMKIHGRLLETWNRFLDEQNEY